MSEYIISAALPRTLTSALVPSMPRLSTTPSTPVLADALVRQQHALLFGHEIAAWPPAAGVPAQLDVQTASKRRPVVNRAAANAYGFRAWSPPF